MKIATLIDTRGFNRWCEENNLWHPLSPLVSEILPPFLPSPVLISLPSKNRFISRNDSYLFLNFLFREGNVKSSINFYFDPKRKIDISNISPYDEILVFDIEEKVSSSG